MQDELKAAMAHVTPGEWRNWGSVVYSMTPERVEILECHHRNRFDAWQAAANVHAIVMAINYLRSPEYAALARPRDDVDAIMEHNAKDPALAAAEAEVARLTSLAREIQAAAALGKAMSVDDSEAFGMIEDRIRAAMVQP